VVVIMDTLTAPTFTCGRYTVTAQTSTDVGSINLGAYDTRLHAMGLASIVSAQYPVVVVVDTAAGESGYGRESIGYWRRGRRDGIRVD
jgi:hypothetical protein